MSRSTKGRYVRQPAFTAKLTQVELVRPRTRRRPDAPESSRVPGLVQLGTRESSMVQTAQRATSSSWSGGCWLSLPWWVHSGDWRTVELENAGGKRTEKVLPCISRPEFTVGLWVSVLERHHRVVAEAHMGKATYRTVATYIPCKMGVMQFNSVARLPVGKQGERGPRDVPCCFSAVARQDDRCLQVWRRTLSFLAI